MVASRPRPQPGPQAMLLACPIQEVFFGGARGGGKSYATILDFVNSATLWPGLSGIVFRRTYPELEQYQHDCDSILPHFGYTYKVAERTWQDGKSNSLKLRHLDNDRDTGKYQGHSYQWMCFDEAGEWPSIDPINKLRGALRGSRNLRFVLTGNPGGPGHNWLKARYVAAGVPGRLIKEKLPDGTFQHRVFIPSRVDDNKALLESDPEYKSRLYQTGPKWLVDAWLDGNWDIVAGGAFNDLWNREVHCLPRFAIPTSWEVYRAFDWGSSHPFSVGWWAECDGSPVHVTGRGEYTFPKGTLIRIAEWYGWSGKPNQGIYMTDRDIGLGIKEREAAIRRANPGVKIKPGPGDNSIFNRDPGKDSVAQGISSGLGETAFLASDKSPGSRVKRVEAFRRRLKASIDKEGPGVYTFVDNLQFIRCVPDLPRSSKDPDDVDTDAEDHIWDETGYMMTFDKPVIRRVGVTWG